MAALDHDPQGTHQLDWGDSAHVPGRPVQHHSGLIPRFIATHRQLLEAYHALKQASDASDAPAFKVALEHFRSLLVPHLMEEAVRLYTYLRRELRQRGDAEAYQRVNAYKSEMNGIGLAAMEFVDTHLQMADHEIDFIEVRAALRQIGKLLGDRIHREESDLYQLYQKTI